MRPPTRSPGASTRSRPRRSTRPRSPRRASAGRATRICWRISAHVSDVAMMFWSERAARRAGDDAHSARRRAAGASRSTGCAAHSPDGRVAAALRHRRRRASRVAGLNPHAGEDGLLGREDDATSSRPAVERALGRGHRRQRTVSGRHAVRACVTRRIRRRDRLLPRSGTRAGQAARVRQGRERDARPAHHPHVGRSRHGVRHRANREWPTREVWSKRFCSRRVLARQGAPGAMGETPSR